MCIEAHAYFAGVLRLLLFLVAFGLFPCRAEVLWNFINHAHAMGTTTNGGMTLHFDYDDESAERGSERARERESRMHCVPVPDHFLFIPIHFTYGAVHIPIVDGTYHHRHSHRSRCAQGA